MGYLAYDTVSYFEPRVPVMPKDPQGLPESVFMFADTMLVFDHLQHDIKVVSHVRLDGDVEVGIRRGDGEDRPAGGTAGAASVRAESAAIGHASRIEPEHFGF